MERKVILFGFYIFHRNNDGILAIIFIKYFIKLELTHNSIVHRKKQAHFKNELLTERVEQHFSIKFLLQHDFQNKK